MIRDFKTSLVQKFISDKIYSNQKAVPSNQRYARRIPIIGYDSERSERWPTLFRFDKIQFEDLDFGI